MRIRYLKGLKRAIAYAFPHNYVKMKIDSNDDLPLGEILDMHNVTFSSSQFLIKIRISTTEIYSQKNLLINYLESNDTSVLNSIIML